MNKLEKVLKECGHKTNLNINKKVAVEAMIEFGEICFEAGRDQYWDDGGSGCLEFKYYEYEDFLKEIEDETGN